LAAAKPLGQDNEGAEPSDQISEAVIETFGEQQANSADKQQMSKRGGGATLAGRIRESSARLGQRAGSGGQTDEQNRNQRQNGTGH
jgi:hypothetical protein